MLQIFTYWTGLAFTGRSAACAPATATRPAAEPRRRLFTIFILNLQTLFLERVPYPPSATAPDGTSPCSPLTGTFRTTCAIRGPDRPKGECPPPSLCHINRPPPPGNEEAPFSQALTTLFERVLPKITQSGMARTAPASSQQYGFILNGLWQKSDINFS